MAQQLSIDWIACDGRGLCAELAPELIEPDEWGYPVIAEGRIPASLEKVARDAVRACPKLALRLVPAPDGQPVSSGSARSAPS